MRHRLRNRIIIRCLSSGSSGSTGCDLMPDDADVNPGDALKLGVTRCVPDVMPDVRTPDVAYAAYATEATIATEAK